MENFISEIITNIEDFVSETSTRIILLIFLLVIITGGWFLFFRGDSEPIEPLVGDLFNFGPYQWRILDMQADRKLLIRKNIGMSYRVQFHDAGDERMFDPLGDGWLSATWAESSIRQWLNNDFYAKFTSEEQARIAETRVINNANPWSGISGGENTVDKIFFLSLEEVVQYFGDSGQLQNRPRGGRGWFICDQYNDVRRAVTENGHSWRWWLRSPGYHGHYAATVGSRIYLDGTSIFSPSPGIRPALWLYR